jgi:hypothetical protein
MGIRLRCAPPPFAAVVMALRVGGEQITSERWRTRVTITPAAHAAPRASTPFVGPASRADAIRAEEAPTPHPDCRTITDGFPGALIPRRAMSAVEPPIAELRRTSGYVRNVPILLQKSVGSTLSAGLRSENLGSRSLGRLPGMGCGDARALMADATNATDGTYATLGAAVSGGWSVSLARRRRF